MNPEIYKNMDLFRLKTFKSSFYKIIDLKKVKKRKIGQTTEGHSIIVLLTLGGSLRMNRQNIIIFFLLSD